MGKKIKGVVLAVGTAGAVPAAETDGQIASGKTVRTADASTQSKVKQGVAATNVRVNATPGQAVSGSTATNVKVKTGATPSTPTKLELGSQTNPTVKQGSTPGGKVANAVAPPTPPKKTEPKVKSGAASGGEVSAVVKR